MKQLTSIVVVFLSVVVISLATFRAPRVETSPIQKQLESTMAMRKWQSETAKLYRDRAGRHDAGSWAGSTAMVVTTSPVKVAAGTASEASGGSVLPTSSQTLLSTSQTQWEAIASFALADAERWDQVRRDVAPQQSHRRRSTWAWIVALAAGAFAIVGLLVSAWIAPERTIDSTKNTRAFKQASTLNDWPRIHIPISPDWVEIRQTAGVNFRRWFGYVLVVTALISCWIF